MSLLIKQDGGRRRRVAGTRSQLCVICNETFDCSLNYKGQKFACWNCRMSSEALEKGFTCPITNTIMFNPTVASDGHCYERHAIQIWITTAVDNEKRPLSPVTGLPLVNLILKKDKKKLQQIEDFVKNNKLHQHPDRVEPPRTGDIQQRQRNISTQAAQWLTEAMPSKQERPGATETTDMAEYAAQSAKRRKEEIAAGDDLALAVRSARDLADLLKELDCVRSDDTLATAIGSSIDFLTPNAVNDCFYICRERNRIVHESSAEDELTDIQRFRSAVQRAKREIQVQIDIQNSYKSPSPTPVPQPRSLPTSACPSLADSPSSSVSMPPSPVVRCPPAFVATFKLGIYHFHRGKYPEAINILSDFTARVDGKVYPNRLSFAKRAINHGLYHFHKGEYPQAIAVLSDFTKQVDGKVYPDRLAFAKRTIAKAKSRSEDLKKADDAFCKKRMQEAFRLYKILAGGDRRVLFEEDCFALVMFHMGTCCNGKTSIPCFSEALKKEPGNGIFLHHRARAYMELEDFKKAKVDLETIDLATVDSTLAHEITDDLEMCKTKTDPMFKRGHLEEDEIDELMKRFGLED